MPASQFNPDAFPDSPYAQELRGGFRWLRFPKALEGEYGSFHVSRVRARLRVFLAAMPLVTLVEWIREGIDLEAIRGSAFELVLMFVFLAGGNWLAWSRHFTRLYLPVVTPIAAVVLAVAAYELPGGGGVTDGYAEAMMFVMNGPLMTHLFLGFPFYTALALNVACAAIFLIAAAGAGLGGEAMSTFFMLIPISVVVGAMLAYTSESAGRKQFLQEKLLGEIASRDPLTGLRNRASFDSHLECLWKQAQRTGEAVGLLMLDLDQFKLCNDTRGHQAGDECLRAVAAVLKSQARRPLDLAARYGGEEFALILYQTTAAQLLASAEAARAEIETLAIPNPGANAGVITMSGGVAVVVPAPGRSMHALVQMADEALYAAKSAGRNCVRASELELSAVTTGRFKRRGFLRAVS